MRVTLQELTAVEHLPGKCEYRYSWLLYVFCAFVGAFGCLSLAFPVSAFYLVVSGLRQVPDVGVCALLIFFLFVGLFWGYVFKTSLVFHRRIETDAIGIRVVGKNRIRQEIEWESIRNLTFTGINYYICTEKDAKPILLPQAIRNETQLLATILKRLIFAKEEHLQCKFHSGLLGLGIASFFCLSGLGMIYAGYMENEKALMLAGIFLFVFCAIPPCRAPWAFVMREDRLMVYGIGGKRVIPYSEIDDIGVDSTFRKVYLICKGKKTTIFVGNLDLFAAFVAVSRKLNSARSSFRPDNLTGTVA